MHTTRKMDPSSVPSKMGTMVVDGVVLYTQPRLCQIGEQFAVTDPMALAPIQSVKEKTDDGAGPCGRTLTLYWYE